MNPHKASTHPETYTNTTKRHTSAVAEAFDRKAKVYDDFGLGHTNLARMRRKVRSQIMSILSPGDQILELNAGTGADALFLANNGYQVMATDISPKMVEKIQEKIIIHKMQADLRAMQCDFVDLNQLVPNKFDMVFSNFGGINCTDNPGEIIQWLPQVLRPQGWVVWTVMPRVCLWDLGAILVGDFKTTTRRFKPGGSLAHVEGIYFKTTYFNPDELLHAFGANYELHSIRGISVFTPPADRKQFAQDYSRIYRILAWLDDRLSDRAPFNRWGDFYMITLRYLGNNTLAH